MLYRPEGKWSDFFNILGAAANYQKNSANFTAGRYVISGQTEQGLNRSIMEKAGVDGCLRILLSCFKARTSFLTVLKYGA